MTREVPNFDLIFRQGTVFGWPDETTSYVDVISAGELSLPSGRVIVRDPASWLFDMSEELPVAEVHAGQYPVTLSISHKDKPLSPKIPPPIRSVAAAQIVVSDVQVTSWEIATPQGHDLAELGKDEIFGFGVDSGQGCFMDADGLGFLKELQEEEVRLDRATEQILESRFAMVSDDAASANIVIFQCGMGDGFYPVWLGRAADGSVARIVADLEVLDHSLGPV